MKGWGLIFVLGMAGTFGSVSCVGDGTGLNEFGDLLGPLDSLVVSIPLEPTLESIEANIFRVVCAVKCHRSPLPKKNLNLEPGLVYSNLVNIPSEERPELMRVLPGDAENSYMIWKLEGRTGIKGRQMPLNLPPLSDEKIQAIRNWIDDGALQ